MSAGVDHCTCLPGSTQIHSMHALVHEHRQRGTGRQLSRCAHSSTARSDVDAQRNSACWSATSAHAW
eukprot:scaffold80832_cov95-Phaeocystis_antarctica.AAC.1